MINISEEQQEIINIVAAEALLEGLFKQNEISYATIKAIRKDADQMIEEVKKKHKNDSTGN